jgi:hypothetical protein
MVWVAFVAGPLLPVAWLLAMIPMLVAMLWIPAACLMITDS